MPIPLLTAWRVSDIAGVRGFEAGAYDRVMSLIYTGTTLKPSKYELLAAWLPTQTWFTGDVAALAPVGAYRFDDPEGEVGLEGHLFTAGTGDVFHLPVSYRGVPLEGGDLVGTIEHGVLGTRWVYTGASDPVFRAVLAAAIAQGGAGETLKLVDASGNETEGETSVRVAGTGAPSAAVPEMWAATVAVDGTDAVPSTGFAKLIVHQVVGTADASADGGADRAGELTLRGAWGEGEAARVGAVLVMLVV